MARHVIMIEVTTNSKAQRRMWAKSDDREKAAIYGARYQGVAFSGQTVYRAGGSTPLVAATRAVKALLAAHHRD